MAVLLNQKYQTSLAATALSKLCLQHTQGGFYKDNF